jgi:hypothetical protein
MKVKEPPYETFFVEMGLIFNALDPSVRSKRLSIGFLSASYQLQIILLAYPGII